MVIQPEIAKVRTIAAPLKNFRKARLGGNQLSEKVTKSGT